MKDKIAACWKSRTKTDVAALLVFLFLAALLAFSAHTRWVSEDEYMYYAVACRFAQGAKPFFDDLAVTDMTGLFLSVPCRIYMAIVGSTDGIVLFMRYLYIIVISCLYWFCFSRLREKRILASVAAALFCAHPTGGVPALSYYNLCHIAALLAVLTLYFPKKPLTRPRLMLAGCIFSFAVLCEPVVAAVYAAFSLLVLIRAVLRRKKQPFDAASPLSMRSWLWISVGIAAAAAVTLLLLQILTGLDKIIGMVPYIVRLYGNILTPITEKLKDKFLYVTEKFGVANCVLLVLTTFIGIGAFIAQRKKEFGVAVRLGVFLFTAASVLSGYIHVFRHADIIHGVETFGRSFAFPAFCYACASLALCRKEGRRFAVFCAAVLLFSLPMDLSSEFTMTAAGCLAYFPAVICTGAFMKELRSALSEPDNKIAKKLSAGSAKAAAAAAIAVACGVLLCETAMLAAQLNLSLALDRYSDSKVLACEAGPAKGVYEPETRLEYTYALLDDIAALRSMNSGPVYITTVKSCFCHLAAQLPVASFSPFYQEDDLDGRLLEFWEKRPDLRPEYVYVILSSEEQQTLTDTMKKLHEVCEFEAKQGRVGFFLHVTNWKTVS